MPWFAFVLGVEVVNFRRVSFHHSVSLVAIFAAISAPGSLLAATLPVGFFTGDDFQYSTSDERDGRGEVLRAGAFGGTGGYTNDTGEVLTLNGGTNRPGMIIGGKPDGDPVGGTGSVLLTGEGSGIRMLGNGDDPAVNVGEFTGTGSFTVRDGAFLEMEDLTDIPRPRPNRRTTINVGTDNGDRGLPGVGAFTMSDGTVSLQSSLETRIEVGFGTGSIGTWTMTDGSELLLRQRDVTGLEGNRSGLSIGEDGGTGTMEVTASSVVLESDRLAELRLGDNNGVGTLTVSDGGTIDVNGSGEGRIEIGDQDALPNEGFTANVLVTGAGSRLSTNGRIFVGTDRSSESVGTATLLANDGATVEASEIIVGAGGILGGDRGSYVGDVTIGSGGVLAAGTSPGLTTIVGDLVLDGGLLEVEIGGTDPLLFDRTVVTGSVIASSAFEIVLDFVDGFVPSAGESFEFLTAGSFGDSFFENVTLSARGLPGTADFFLGNTSSGGLSVDVASVTPIPLPASAWFLALAVGLLGWFKRRLRSSTEMDRSQAACC